MSEEGSETQTVSVFIRFDLIQSHLEEMLPYGTLLFSLNLFVVYVVCLCLPCPFSFFFLYYGKALCLNVNAIH